MEPEKQFNEAELHGIIRRLLNLVILLVIAIVLIPVVIYSVRFFSTKKSAGDQVPEKVLTAPLETTAVPLSNYWTAPEFSSIKDANLKAQIEYGKDLIAHTSKYLGPNGSDDCFERSLNGQALDTTSKEMQAIVAYINFLGSNVEKGKKAEGSGFKDLAYLDRPADPEKGKAVYETKCQSCHQANGEGLLNPAKTEYTFPALWGKGSYNDGAGLYRISNFAKYVKYNMPQGVSHDAPQLSDEEAWDVAAFVNTQPRPHINVPKDWPDKSKKPVDHPFGPYADKFTEKQHKFGPFQPIADLQKKNSKK